MGITEDTESREAQRRRWSEPSPYWTAVEENKRGAGRNFAPAAARNTAVILAELGKLLPSTGRVLEVASGTGQHICAFAAAFPEIIWQPSDMDSNALNSIAAWRNESHLTNILPPKQIDLNFAEWGDAADGPFDAIFASNLLHISSWEVALSLFDGASKLLRPDGFLFVYGCFSRDGNPVSESNLQFDQSLQSRDPRWGIRDSAATAAAVEKFELVQSQVIEMPANNTVIVVRRCN